MPTPCTAAAAAPSSEVTPSPPRGVNTISSPPRRKRQSTVRPVEGEMKRMHRWRSSSSTLARRAVRGEVRGRSAGHPVDVRDRPRDERRIVRERHRAHRAVDAFLDEIHRAVGDHELELELRMAREEAGQRGKELLVDERVRDARAQPPARRAMRAGERVLGLGEVVEHAHAAFVERAPLVGEREPPRRAVEEPHAEPLLELRHRGGRGRPRDVETLGGAREGACSTTRANTRMQKSWSMDC